MFVGSLPNRLDIHVVEGLVPVDAHIRNTSDQAPGQVRMFFLAVGRKRVFDLNKGV